MIRFIFSKVIPFFVIGGLVGLINPSSSANTEIDEQYSRSLPKEMTKGTIGAIYDPSREDSFGPSYLFAGNATTPGQIGGLTDAISCSDANDPKCATDRQFMLYMAYLPECNSQIFVDCVAAVTAIRPDGSEIAGKFVRRAPNKGPTEFDGNPDRRVPQGRSPGLWEFPSVRHQGGSNFLVAVTLNGRSDRDASNQSSGTLKMAIMPVSSVVPGPTGGIMTMGRNSDGSYILQGNFDRRYVYHTPQEALTRWPFPEDLRYRLTVRLNVPQMGWLHGRVFDPSAQISNSRNGQEITVEASPVSVPLIDPWTKWNELPETLRNIYQGKRPGGDFCLGWVEDKWEDLCINVGGDSAATEETMQIFLEWVKIAKDKAVASKSTWSVRTMRGEEMTEKSECYRGDQMLVGFVATNSTVYLAGPPTFNNEEKSLDYKVASPHFNKSGKQNIGTYSLLMRADTARCVYGFKDAPINATVSVLSSDGYAQVATTRVAQEDGWLSLSAYGFGYSSPTVRVAIREVLPEPVASATPESTPTPSPTSTLEPSFSKAEGVVKSPQKNVKKTIACTKGKEIKKVSAIKPKCPKGWKKKA